MSTAADEAPDPFDCVQAYWRWLPAVRALDPRTVLPMNIAVTAATLEVHRAIHRVKPLLDALSTLPDYGPADVERLASLAAAMRDATCTARAGDGDRTSALAADCALRRRQALAVARALIALGFLAPSMLDGISAGRSHTDIANDARALVTLLDAHRPRVAGMMDKDAIDALRDASDRLYSALVLRLAGPTGDELSKKQIVARLFTMMRAEYERLRKAVQYLRYFEGDADRFAPSLHRKKRAPGKSAAKQRRTVDTKTVRHCADAIEGRAPAATDDAAHAPHPEAEQPQAGLTPKVPNGEASDPGAPTAVNDDAMPAPTRGAPSRDEPTAGRRPPPLTSSGDDAESTACSSGHDLATRGPPNATPQGGLTPEGALGATAPDRSEN